MCTRRETRVVAATFLAAVFSMAYLPVQAADKPAEQRLAALVPGDGPRQPGGGGTGAAAQVPVPNPGSSADMCHPDSNRGPITYVIVSANGVYFRLRGTPYEVKGIKWRLGGYYILERSQPGFDTIASYILGAATTKCLVKVKCTPIANSPSARVEYFEIEAVDGCNWKFP